MIEVFPAAMRHITDLGWLRSQSCYSFGAYQDSERTGFGVMRVCNDDYVAPGKGFGAHPHSDMEIVSIVLNGQIRHEDNMGNNVVTDFGEVQRMSAGSGVIHAEFNATDTEELRLLQLWFMPQTRGTVPSYEAKAYDITKLDNAWLPVVSNDPAANAAKIGQDLSIYLSKVDQGKTIEYTVKANRNLFVYLISGKATVADRVMETGDIAEISKETQLSTAAESDTFMMLIDMT